jgi:ankyrin repeat protein
MLTFKVTSVVVGSKHFLQADNGMNGGSSPNRNDQPLPEKPDCYAEGQDCIGPCLPPIFISIASGKGDFSPMERLIQQGGLDKFFTVENTFKILTSAIDVLATEQSKSGNEIKKTIIGFLGNLSEYSIKNVKYSLFNINNRDSNGKTLLMLAASCGNENLIEILKDFGANPTLKDQSGRTAAMHAKDHGHKRISAQLNEDAKNFGL